MKTCSGYLRTGAFLQIFAVATFLLTYLYAMQYVPDFPTSNTGKIIYTPRSHFLLLPWMVFFCATVVCAVLNLVGLICGPRTWKCYLLGLPSILAAGVPVLILLWAFMAH
jgi:hypothetical protein